MGGYSSLGSAANALGSTKKASIIGRQPKRDGTANPLKTNKVGVSVRNPNGMPLHLHLIRQERLKPLSSRARLPFQLTLFRS